MRANSFFIVEWASEVVAAVRKESRRTRSRSSVPKAWRLEEGLTELVDGVERGRIEEVEVVDSRMGG